MSTESVTMENRPKAMDLKYSLRLGLSLFVITAVVALILAAVNSVTAGPIAAREEAERQAAMQSVSPGANVFSEAYSDDETVERITNAYADTQLVGYCVEVAPNGFGGAISMMVGVDTGGSVTGVVLLDHEETAGLGSKAEEPEFLDQYLGKSGTITVNTGDNAINAITGATITSRAVTEGVNTALTAVLHYQAEGGGLDEDGSV